MFSNGKSNRGAAGGVAHELLGEQGPGHAGLFPEVGSDGAGEYVVVWEEQALTSRGWEYKRTMANTIAITGGLDDKQIVPGQR